MAKSFLYGNGGGSSIDTSQITATQADILSGKKAYIDDSGEAKSGTMQNRTSVLFGGTDSTAFENSQITGSAHNNYVGAFDYQVGGYVDPTVRVHIPNLTPNNIKKGVKIGGKNGFIEGVYEDSSPTGILNFPLTISTSQPTPVKNGHVWINTTRVSNSPSGGIYVRDYITADIPNNSVIITIGDYKKSRLIALSKINNVTAQIWWDSGQTAPWLAGNSGGNFDTYLPQPQIYTKVNNTIYIENAYIWDGSKWLMVSTADKYFIGSGATNGAMSRLAGANWIGNTLSQKSFGLGTLAGFSPATSCSKNGKFIFKGFYNGLGMEVYKREGDTFTLFQSFSTQAFSSYFSGNNVDVAYSAIFSTDGNYMAFTLGSRTITNNDSNKAKLFKFKLNSAGTAYDLIGYTQLPNLGSPYPCNIGGNNDLSVIIIGVQGSGDSYYYYYRVLGAFTSTQTAAQITTASSYYHVTVSPNGVYAALLPPNNSYSGYALYIDYGKQVHYQYQYPFAHAVGYGNTCYTITNTGEFLGLATPSDTKSYKIYQGKITFNGSAVSITPMASVNITASNAGTSGYSYSYLSGLSYTGDKSNCYFAAVSGGTGSSSTAGNNLRLYKANFSGENFTGLTLLSSIDITELIGYHTGILIGGQ